MSKIAGWFSPTNKRQAELDQYIESRKPQSGADVEKYIRQFEDSQKRRFL